MRVVELMEMHDFQKELLSSSKYCISWCFILRTLSASMLYGQYFEIGHGPFLSRPFHLSVYNLLLTFPEIQGGSNITGTDLCVNKPHCAAAVRP